MRSAPKFQLDTMPSSIEHEDRVIGNAFDQMAELTFALVELSENIPDLTRTFADALFQRFVEMFGVLVRPLARAAELALALLV